MSIETAFRCFGRSKINSKNTKVILSKIVLTGPITNMKRLINPISP